VTFWEDNGPLAAEVAAMLGKRYNSVEAHRVAKSKFLTHDTLLSQRYHEESYRPWVGVYNDQTSAKRIVFSDIDVMFV